MKKLFTLALSFMATVAVSHAEVLTFSVYDSDSQTYCQDFQSEFTINANGTYTIENFVNTGQPLTFTTENLINDTDCEITLGGDNISLYADYSMGYLLDPDGDYVTGIVYDESGNATNVNYLYVYYGSTSTLTPTVADGVRTIEGSINFSGNLDSGDYAPYYYAMFSFTDPTYDSIKSVTTNDENAPVEYYNLQGMRISNPENGIFIRRQGSKTSKVTIK